MVKSFTVLGTIWMLLFFSIKTQAQALQFGIQTGVGVSSVYNFLPAAERALRDTDWGIPIAYPNFSYGASGYVSTPLNENFSLALEPGFLSKGYTIKYVSETDLIHNIRYLTYLQLPALLEMRLNNRKWIVFGPELGWLLHARQKNNDEMEPIDLNHYYSKNRLDVGLQGGLFYNIAPHVDAGLKLGASIKPLERYFVQSQEYDILVRITKRNLYLHSFVRFKL